MTKTIDITIACQYCRKEYTVKPDAKNYILWKNGNGFIQDLLPELSAGERELLISNICDSCWVEIWETEESETEED